MRLLCLGVWSKTLYNLGVSETVYAKVNDMFFMHALFKFDEDCPLFAIHFYLVLSKKDYFLSKQFDVIFLLKV